MQLDENRIVELEKAIHAAVGDIIKGKHPNAIMENLREHMPEETAAKVFKAASAHCEAALKSLNTDAPETPSYIKASRRLNNRNFAKDTIKIGAAFALLFVVVWGATGGEGPSGRISQLKFAGLLGFGLMIYGVCQWLFSSSDN